MPPEYHWELQNTAADNGYLFDDREKFRMFKFEDDVYNLYQFKTRAFELKDDTIYIFVLSPANELYVLPSKIVSENKNIHHSSFLNGGPVLAAGEFDIKGAQIIWSNASGHYRPHYECLKHILTYFTINGMKHADIKDWICIESITQEPIDSAPSCVKQFQN